MYFGLCSGMLNFVLCILLCVGVFRSSLAYLCVLWCMLWYVNVVLCLGLKISLHVVACQCICCRLLLHVCELWVHVY